MKQISTLIITCFFLLTINARHNTNTHQWIDYGKTYYKIKVHENGIYQIDYETLKDYGITMETIDGNRLCLINEGEEIPLYVSNTGKWEEQDYLQFYGEKLDGEFDKRLFENPNHQLHPYWSQFTDTAVYFLTIKDPSTKIMDIKNDLTDVPAKEDYFIHESIFINNRSHFNGIPDFRLKLPYALEDNDTLYRKFSSYYPSYGEGEGWMGNLYAAAEFFAENFIKIDVPTPSVFDNGTNAQIEFKILGVSDDDTNINDHYLKAYLNDQLIEEDRFEGYSVRSYNVEVPLHELGNEVSTFKFEALDTVARTDKQSYSYIKITYLRKFNFNAIDHFTFNVDNKPEGNYIEFNDLSAEETYWLYDLTHQLKLRLHFDEVNQIHQAYLPYRAGENQRQFILQKENEIKNITQLTATNFTDYGLSANQGDYIIITHPQLISNKEAVAQYAEYRQSNTGGDYKVVTVNVEELYDQYSYGIRKHPLAIKYFLTHTLNDWAVSPKHCFLLGKGIKNSKCRTTQDNWLKNLVPTFGDTPSDQYFGSIGFDPLSYMAIGRLSAETETDIINYLNKVKQVEQFTAQNCNYVEDAKWKHRMLHIGGGDAIEQQTRFAERLFNQANIAKNGSLTAKSNYLLRGGSNPNEENGCKSAPKDCLSDAFNQGVQLVNFLGHASGLLWEVNIGLPEDHIYNNRFPIMISQSSFNGDIYKTFADENMLSMSESWLHATNAGAVALLGFSGLFEFTTGPDLVDELFAQIYQEKPGATLGEQVNAAINHHYNVNEGEKLHAINQFTFSGDPALRYAVKNKPELSIKEEQATFTFDQINDFYYTIDIAFEFDRLNVPAIEAVPYKIILMSNQTEEIVAEGWLKDGETGYYRAEVTLLPEQRHQYRIQLDAENTYDEICEENNSIIIKAGEFLINDVATSLNEAYQIKNYPNPFDEQTVFTITLSDSMINNTSHLMIYNLKGQTVKQFTLKATTKPQQISWNGDNQAGNSLAAGTYWYQMKNQDNQAISEAKKIVLVK